MIINVDEAGLAIQSKSNLNGVKAIHSRNLQHDPIFAPPYRYFFLLPQLDCQLHATFYRSFTE